MQIRETSYLGSLKRTILFRFEDIAKHGDVVMLESINDSQELQIDDIGSFTNSKGINISSKNIYFYGNINTSDETDCDIIKRKNLVDGSLQHSWVPGNFNYQLGWGDTHNWLPTADAVKWFEYCHCRIGKPKKVVAYKIARALL